MTVTVLVAVTVLLATLTLTGEVPRNLTGSASALLQNQELSAQTMDGSNKYAQSLGKRRP